MWINRIAWLFDGEEKLALSSLVVLGIFLVFWVVAYLCGGVDIFTSVSLLSIGGACLLAGYYSCSAKGVRNFFFTFIAIAGGLYLLLFFALLIKRRVRERKKRRQEMGRKVEYTLPDRNNSYVRDRLHTALQIKDNVENTCNRTQMGLRLSYAKELVTKLKESGLSVIEQAELGEMTKILLACASKEEWSGKEVQTVNEIFMRILKLSAKYDVAI